MKKTLCTLLAALLLSVMLIPAACAESIELLWEGKTLSTLSESASAVTVYEYGKGYGLMTLDGQEILPMQYNRISNSKCTEGFYVANSGEDMNGNTLFDQSGKALTDGLYGDIEMLSDKWVVASKLVLTTDENYDYWAFGSSDHYNIDTCDVIYVPSGKVATLTRDQYQSATAFGDYLLVLDRSGAVQLYDSQFQPVESAFTASYQDEYYITDKGLSRNLLVSRITGETIATGYEDVNEVFSDIFISVENEDGTGLIDNTGAVLLNCEYDDIDESNNPRYLELEKDGLLGLYDLEACQIVLPCEYDSFLDPDYETMCYNGYFIVEKDGKFGYTNGTAMTYPMEYAEDDVLLMGSSFLIENEDETYTLVAADGVVTPLTGVTEVEDRNNASLGRYILAANAEGLWGILDWHGTWIVEPILNSMFDFDFVDANHIIVDDDYMYVIK